MTRHIIRERVSERLRIKYRALEPFDTGERDERRARSQLRPQGDVGVVTYVRSPRAAETAGGVIEPCKEDPMNVANHIPPGARVRSTLPGSRWIGTVISEDDGHGPFPYLIAWDCGGNERCAASELHVLTVTDAPEHYARLAEEAAGLFEKAPGIAFGGVRFDLARARMDRALGEGRR